MSGVAKKLLLRKLLLRKLPPLAEVEALAVGPSCPSAVFEAAVAPSPGWPGTKSDSLVSVEQDTMNEAPKLQKLMARSPPCGPG